MSKVTFDYSKACGFVQDHEMQYMSELAEQAKEKLLARTGAGNDFLGWIDLPVDYDKDEFDRIKKAAEKIREDSEVLLVIGIGGSYLGARAAIEFLGHSFANVVSKEVRKSPEIYYVGNSISSTYVKDLIDVIGDRDFSINMISKSGTTTEPAIAFRVFKELLEKKYGKEEAAKRIYGQSERSVEKSCHRRRLRDIRCAGRCRRSFLCSYCSRFAADRGKRSGYRQINGRSGIGKKGGFGS